MATLLGEGTRLRSGRYELKRRIGSGGAATVWLGEDTLLERPVAVKVLSEGLGADDDWLARFRREARIAARLSHPNLVPVYDFEANTDRPYLVMAYLEGGSLRDEIEGSGVADPEGVLADLLRALDHIHEHGVVHRDIKPANVLLDARGGAHLTDFGIARPQDATSITRTGQLPGTGRYLAPELWRGEPASVRSDLFSCGVLLSQCLDGRTDARLEAVAAKLASEDPALRPATARGALALLEDEPVLAHSPARAGAADPPPPAAPTAGARPGPGRYLPLAALAAVALAFGFAIVQGLGGGDEEPQPAAAAREDAQESHGDGGANAGSDEAPVAEGDAGTGEAEPTPASASLDDVAPAGDPAVLNDEGFALLGAGDAEGAVPLLERSVAGYREAGESGVPYGYALYNLADAYIQTGRAAEAIPLLKERLGIPDQVPEVRAKLAEARAAAG